MTSVQTKRPMTNAIAVQPTAWGEFDEWGCLWAKDMHHAFRLAQAFGEECMIWMCPQQGEPIRWCRSDANTNAIADLVFGAPKVSNLNTKDGITTPW